jgi:hypothetical protein
MLLARVVAVLAIFFVVVMVDVVQVTAVHFSAVSTYPCYSLTVLCAMIIVSSAIKIVGTALRRVCRVSFRSPLSAFYQNINYPW